MADKMHLDLEERLNALSHGLGILLGLIGFFFLLEKNTGKTPYALFSIIIYNTSIVILFSASTIYHSVSKVHLRKIYQIVDHISIYLLIAGTYTPIALINLEKGSGWSLFFTVWGIAAFGAVMKLFFTGKYEFVSLLLYLIMGWLIVLDFSSLLATTTDLGIYLLFAGGACYTIGILFYAIRKIPFNHFIWHVFVLGGAFCHWLFIYLDVV